jgi:hypothetical protein
MRSVAMAASLLTMAGCAALPSATPRETGAQSDLRLPSRERYPDSPAVYLLRERRYFMRLERPSLTRIDVHDAIALLTPGGLSFATVHVPDVGRDQFELLFARVIDARGVRTDVAPQEIEEGPRGRMLAFPNAKPGSVLEYRYVITRPHVMYSLSDSVTQAVPTERASVLIELSKGIIYSVTTYNDGRAWEVDKSGQVWRLSWSKDAIAAMVDEPFSPSHARRSIWWGMRVLQFSGDEWVAGKYNTWNNAMRQTADILYFRSGDYFEGFEPTVQVAGCADVACRVDRALADLRTLAPFSGFGAEYPLRSARKVLETRAASNFEKARLLWRMLARLGVRAEFAYASKYLEGLFDRNAPISALEHQLVWLPAQAGLAKPMFVDPSCEYCRAGELPEWDLGAPAVILHATKEPLAERPEVEVEPRTIEGASAMPRASREHFRVRLSEAGDAEVALSLESRGEAAQLTRMGELRATASERDSIARAWARHAGEDSEVRAFEPVVWSPDGRVGTRSVVYFAKSYGTVAGPVMTVPLKLLGADWEAVFASDVRRTDIDFRDSRTREEIAEIEAPPGWKVEALPKEAIVETPALTVQVEAKREGERAIVARTLRTRRGHYPRGLHPELKRALDAFRELGRATITFRKM